MKIWHISLVVVIWFGSQISTQAQVTETPIFQSKAYSVFRDRVEQGKFKAIVHSSKKITSDYVSPEADNYSPDITFKFSINTRDNEMISGRDHHVTLQPVNGKCVTNVQYGKQLIENSSKDKNKNLGPNIHWTIHLDLREVFKAFKEKGYYTFFNGDKLYPGDFKGVYVAGSSAPLIWDFNNLGKIPELELKDHDGDGIYETELIMNGKNNQKKTPSRWELSSDISNFPQFKSGYPLSDAIYNMALQEMMKAVEPDSTLRTGKEWSGVWTRDVSYSIILSMAYMQPKVAMYSLLRKVKNGRIIQDTGTGGAYPASTDRIIWAVAAWEIYKVTGDKSWLHNSYEIIRNSVEDDLKNIYDEKSGLVCGESSFLDWREQTYPRWMQPVDIYESENLGTNAVHYKANIVLAHMAKLLNDPQASTKYSQIAANIKKGINACLWMEDKGYYGQYLYGRNFKSLSPRAEALGEALCVLYDIADAKQQRSIVSHIPVTNFGISCIYPQIPNIPPYHNNAVWPFVQSYWALASAKVDNEQSVMESISAVYRPAALFLTNKENLVAETGDFAGTQINSSNMLWSLSGSLALVQKVLFGIEFGTDSLKFHPFVPKVLSGNRSLTNFKYRKAVLNIEQEGFGNQIKSFEVDGKTLTHTAIPSTLTGTHSIKIILANNEPGGSINKVKNYTTIETPTAIYSEGVLSWNPVIGATLYTILKNGMVFKQMTKTSLEIKAADFAEYQVIAVDENKVSSFASEPVVVTDNKFCKTIEIEDHTKKSSLDFKNYQGNGFVEISKTVNQKITIPVVIDNDGTYAISFRYANGNGPINTENKCAIRTLNVDKNFLGTIVMPQRGTKEWSNWGFTNSVHVRLTKGVHKITLSFEPSNENMNGEINQAMLEAVYLYKI